MILTPHPIDKRSTQIADIADSARGGLRTAVYQWLLGLQEIPIQQLQDDNYVQSYLTQAAHGSGLHPDQRSMEEVFTRIVNLGAHAGIYSLRGMPVRKDVASMMSFTMINPHVLDFIKSYMLNLITQVASDARNAIRQIIAYAQQFGGHPYEQARQIRPLIGLTTRQVAAVNNYRQALEDGSYRAAMDRALRDGRYDATLLRTMRQGAALRQEQIDKMVKRYAERQLKHRAEMIARTESLRAANAGLKEAWRQAKEQGLLSDRLREHWIVSRDERTCQFCPQIPGMNPDGVRINGTFVTPYGLLDQPPAHPDCRCTLGLK